MNHPSTAVGDLQMLNCFHGTALSSCKKKSREYGGGGWECVKEFPVDVSDASELKSLETRVHERLERFRCHEAIGFGLTEVFTCSPDKAMAAVEDVVGSKPSMQDEARRLKEKITKGVVSKFRKQYENAYAKLIRDGKKGQVYDAGYEGHFGLDAKDVGLVRLCGEFLEALKNSGGSDPVFRAMLDKEMAGARRRLNAEIARKEAANTKTCSKCGGLIRPSYITCPKCGDSKGLGGASGPMTVANFGCGLVVLSPVLYIFG